MVYPIIMAGGSGTRLWPVSRQGAPKQIYPLIDRETLLQKTWKRMRRGFAAKDIYLATGVGLAEEIKKQLPELSLKNISSEPVRRDTAAGLGLALLKIHQRDPKGIFVYVNADNFIRDEKEFIRLLKLAEKTIKTGQSQITLIGVKPTYPEIGYGYIKIGSRPSPHPLPRGERSKIDEIFEVAEFVEKPDLETAKKYFTSRDYLWNPTLIVARADYFLSLYKKYLPQMWRILSKIASGLDTPREKTIIGKEFVKIKPVSVDYGILEPASKKEKMLVLPTDFGWSDVGHWRAVHEILTQGKAQTVCKGGQHVSIDSHGNLIYNLTGKLIATAGIKNCIIIETDDALLICPKDQAQDVKKIVGELKRRGFEKYL